VLAPEPDVLLLDEPTNHLDVVGIEGLEAVLKASRSAMVLISHDRRFLETLSQATVWLDRGVTRRLDNGFAGFEAWRDAILETEELAGHKVDRRIVQEHWLPMASRAPEAQPAPPRRPGGALGRAGTRFHRVSGDPVTHGAGGERDGRGR
jgi:ATP-binding cassette subfamily F protein uup